MVDVPRPARLLIGLLVLAALAVACSADGSSEASSDSRPADVAGAPSGPSDDGAAEATADVAAEDPSADDVSVEEPASSDTPTDNETETETEAESESETETGVGALLTGGEVLGTFGPKEVFLSPSGRYGYVQAGQGQDDDRCMRPLLEAIEACFEVSGPRFDIQPRWNTSGERMAFASRENPDLMIADASDGSTTVADANDELELFDRTTQLNPGWVGTRLVAFRRDGSLIDVNDTGLPGLRPGLLAPTVPPTSVAMTPPLSTETGGVVISVTDAELAFVTLAEWRSYPFPDSLERRSTRPGPSALRPPLVPIAMTDQGQVVVADSLPGAARRTGNWSATSGAYLLDLDTGEYAPVFVDGTEQASSVVAVGVSPDIDALIFLWADDTNPESPTMRLSTAPLGSLPIDPRKSETLIEAEPGVVLSGSRALNPLVWTANNQTAFVVDREWVHVQLPASAAPGAPTALANAADLDLIAAYLLDNPSSWETAECMRQTATNLAAVEDPLSRLDEVFDSCGGDPSTRERALALLDNELPDVVSALYAAPQDTPVLVRECLHSTLNDFETSDFTVLTPTGPILETVTLSAFSCDPASTRTQVARQIEALPGPERYRRCLVHRLFEIPAPTLDEQLNNANGDVAQATGSVVDLMADSCAAELVDPEIPGPPLATLIGVIESATSAQDWVNQGPIAEGAFNPFEPFEPHEPFVTLRVTHQQLDTTLSYLVTPEQTRVVGFSIRSSSELGRELAQLVETEFDLLFPSSLRDRMQTGSGYGVGAASPFKLCYANDGPIQRFLFLAETVDDC